MSEEAARKLPRYALLALLCVFIFCGLTAQDLWTVRDAESFGIALGARSGSWAEALLPGIAGRALVDHGPLAGWVSAVFMGLFSGHFGDVFAYRLSSLFWFALTTATLWYGTWHLARRPEAQPIAFAFGGEASPRDYGRVVADSAVLLFVATFGIVTRQYEAGPDTALLSLAALNFYGLTRSLSRPFAGSFLAGLASGLAALASTLFAGVWLLAATVIVQIVVRAVGGNRELRVALALSGAALPIALWTGAALLVAPDAASTWLSAWAARQAAFFGIVEASTLVWFLKNFVWYLCPVWPLALWGLYSWRRQLDLTHLLLPLASIGTGLFAALLSSGQTADQVFLAFIPATAVFAAFGLITVKRSRENVLDWFALSVFSLGVLTLWAYWIAWNIGFPPKMARSVSMLAPGIAPEFTFGTVVAMAASLVWFGFVVWRLSHRPKVAWRGPWLAALGMTAAAACSLGLFHTAVDRNRSYADVARETAAELARRGAPEACVAAPTVPPGIQALFAYYGGVRFAPSAEASCRFELVRTSRDEAPEGTIAGPFSRPHTDERFFIRRGTATLDRTHRP